MSEFLKEKYVAPALEELNAGYPVAAAGSNLEELIKDPDTEGDE